MIRYFLRRLLHVIPTVFGVLLITFVLFNVVGGSPAVMALGDKTAPKDLEAYERARGYDKPLIFGRWVSTRLFQDSSFDINPGAWHGVQGAAYERPQPGTPGRLLIRAKQECTAPFAFAPEPATAYRWTIRYRMTSGHAVLRASGVEGAPGADDRLDLADISASKAWQTLYVPFRTGPEAPARFILAADNGDLEVSGIRLRRRVENPFDSQFAFFLGRVLRGDLGESTMTRRPVARMLREGILPSLCLTIPIFFGSLLLSLAIALLCAYVRDSWLDRSIIVVSVALMSVNYIVWIVAGQYLLAFKAGWFPVWGFESWAYLALPVLIGIVSGLGENIRFYRTLMLDEIYKDYVRTAFAKGVGVGGVLFRHVLRNAMIPVLTNVALAIPFLYTGSLLLEGFFGIPGLGGMAINAINASDVDVVRAVVLVGSILYVTANLLTDLAYAWFDPRVKLS